MIQGYIKRLIEKGPGALRRWCEATMGLVSRFKPIPADALDLSGFTERQRGQIRMNYRGPGGCQTCFDTGDVPSKGSPGFNGHERAWNRCPDCEGK